MSPIRQEDALCAVDDLEAVARENPLLAVTVSSRPRQEADFRCTSQGWPRSGVGEVRELALPAKSGYRRRSRSRAGRLKRFQRLLERDFDMGIDHCSNFGGGELKIIAAILERPVFEKVLTHLGLDLQPPPRGGRARLGTTEAD